MAFVVFLVLLLAMVDTSDGTWCVCRSDASSSALQKTIDYACGAGADCTLILQNGPCYNPNTVAAHCSYAANSYFQRKGQAQGTCDFGGTAMVTQSDPSGAGCTYPSSPSGAGTSSSTPSAPGSSTTNPTTNPGSSTTNPGFTPSTGTGGVLGGLGPSGASLDGSDAGLLPNPHTSSLFLTTVLTALVLLRI